MKIIEPVPAVASLYWFCCAHTLSYYWQITEEIWANASFWLVNICSSSAATNTLNRDMWCSVEFGVRVLMFSDFRWGIGERYLSICVGGVEINYCVSWLLSEICWLCQAAWSPQSFIGVVSCLILFYFLFSQLGRHLGWLQFDILTISFARGEGGGQAGQLAPSISDWAPSEIDSDPSRFWVLKK